MWENFRDMPTGLKFFAAQALAGLLFIFGSVVPHKSFSIDGRSVTYSEWWSSGVGIYVSVLGAVLAIAGYLILSKKQF